jgi:hypothetical protein
MKAAKGFSNFLFAFLELIVEFPRDFGKIFKDKFSLFE